MNTKVKLPAYSEQTVIQGTISVTDGHQAAGQSVSAGVASTDVVLRSPQSKYGIQYKLGSNEWVTLGANRETHFDADLSTTTLLVRRAEFAPSPLVLDYEVFQSVSSPSLLVAPEQDSPAIPVSGGGALGPYDTVSALEVAYPAAANPGKHASVGASAPYVDYVSNGTFWTVSGNGATTYLGQVATRCALPDSTAGANRQFNSETWHICWENVAAIGAMWAGGYQTGGNEAAAPAAHTINASVNSPSGTFTRLTFGGIAQGTIHVGGVLASDLVELPTPISMAQAFRIRSYQTSTGSILYNATWGGPNDLFEFGASGVTDKSQGGTITSTAPGATFANFPIAIFGITTKGSVFFLGDSIAAGFGDLGALTYFGDRGLSRMLGQRGIAYANGGVGSATAQAFAAGSVVRTMRLAQAAYCSHVLCNFGTNDLGSRTGSQVAADMNTIAGLFPGKKFVPGTVLPRTTGTWTTTAGQTVVPTFETNRIDYNDRVRSGLASASGYVELADSMETDRNSGIIRVGQNRTATSGAANTPDGLHLNSSLATGYQLVADQIVLPVNLFSR